MFIVKDSDNTIRKEVGITCESPSAPLLFVNIRLSTFIKGGTREVDGDVDLGCLGPIEGI